MRAHLLVNVLRADALEAAERARDFFRDRGAEIRTDRDAASALGVPEVAPEEFPECDLAVSFGGDGTLIRAAHLCSERGTPILGVYYGRFGFVTQCTGEDLLDCLAAFVAGSASVSERMMLEADLLRAGNSVATIHALNEVVLQRSVTVRMLNFNVCVNGIEMTTYPADGVLIATATGSTGYNLSAGGPIMDPRVEGLVLTAVAPHTLSARPLILGADCEVLLSLETEGDAVLSVDSQSRLHLLSGDVVRVRRSPRVTRLVTLRPNDFLTKLGSRLFWGHSLPRAPGA